MIEKFEKFYENYKSKLELDDDIKDLELLAKGIAIKDMMIECPSYGEIKSYINSLYNKKDNIHVAKMFDSIVRAILIKVEDGRSVCEIIDSIRDSINELEIYFDRKWSKSVNKNIYKRREVKTYLESLVDGPDIDTSIYGWKEFIRKQLSHAKYEDSFTEEGVFEKYQTQLSLGKLNLLRDYVFSDTITEDQMLSEFRDLLNGDMKLIKADLKVLKDVDDKSGDLILKEGDLVEVKYKNFRIVDTLGEFFALSKGNLRSSYNLDPNVVVGRDKKGAYLITDLFKLNPHIFQKYNDIIEKFYNILTIENKDIGDNILDQIKNSLSGIMFRSNKYIKKEDLIFKWSLRGQRKHENRLSITHEPVPNAKVYRYIDDPENPHFRNPKIY